MIRIGIYPNSKKKEIESVVHLLLLVVGNNEPLTMTAI